jgi:hypothetical protein
MQKIIKGKSNMYRLCADDESLAICHRLAKADGRLSKHLLARQYFPQSLTDASARHSLGRMLHTARLANGLKLCNVLDDIDLGWRHSNHFPEDDIIAILHFLGPLPEADPLQLPLKGGEPNPNEA